MKKILITGKESYIGVALERRLEQEPSGYIVGTVDMQNQDWEQEDFSGYDIVLHVAGIVHVSSNPKLKDLYFQVNRDLSIEVAKKAKREGVGQFIFLSTMSVYRGSEKENGKISLETEPEPTTIYGDSKLQAEKGIVSLESKNFVVSILRPPMVYGYGSKGNYPKLAKMAITVPLFPGFKNRRSILHIDNLSELIKLVIDNKSGGIFHPQNKECISTGELVKLIANVHGKKMLLTNIFNPFISVFLNKLWLFKKVFGNLYYEQTMSVYPEGEYQIRNLVESIRLTEFAPGADEVSTAAR